MTTEDLLTDILRREGGYVDHPADRGGPTKFGITHATLREWRGRPVTRDDVRALTEEEARAIYRARYVAPFVDVAPSLQPQVVDVAVNCGVTRARAMLALAQANAGDRPVWTQLAIERLKHYARIVKANPSQAEFLPGWINRAVEFLS